MKVLLALLFSQIGDFLLAKSQDEENEVAAMCRNHVRGVAPPREITITSLHSGKPADTQSVGERSHSCREQQLLTREGAAKDTGRCMQTRSLPSIASVVDHLFEGIKRNPPHLRCTLTDEQLLSLHFFFDKLLARALQVVESGAVKCFVGLQSRRTVFQVQGSTASDLYTVFPTHYCSCQAFIYDVVGRKESICCKHQLAARMADALRLCPIIEIPDVALAHLLIAT